MALNLGGGGDFLPYAKFNGKAGRWYAKIAGAEVEVQNPTFVADLANIRTGWFYFREGAAPEIILDPNLSTPAPKPARTYTDSKGNVKDCFKRGFELKLFSNNSFGGLVVLNGAGLHLNNAVNDLHQQYEAGIAANPGMLPVVSATGTVPMKDAQGTNFKPVFAIIKWVPRPAEFDAAATATPSVVGTTSNTNSPPPQAAVAPVRAAVSEF